MQHVRNCKDKQGYGCRKQITVTALHGVCAFHVANFGMNHGAAGILVALAGLNQRLLAHHAAAFHFFHLVVLVGDDPVPAEQFYGLRAIVGDRDGVRKCIRSAAGVRLLFEVLGGYLDIHATRLRFIATHVNTHLDSSPALLTWIAPLTRITLLTLLHFFDRERP